MEPSRPDYEELAARCARLEREVTDAEAAPDPAAEQGQLVDLSLFKKLTDRAPMGVMIASLSGELLYANEAFAAMHGYAASELLGQQLTILLEDPAAGQGELPWGLRPGEEATAAVEVALRRKDGSVFPAQINAMVIEAPGGVAQLISAMITDVSASRQESEQRQLLEKRLRQSQKMEAIGTLAGGIAHDFNNILQVILGNADLALIDLPEGSEAADSIKEVLIASQRAMELVNRILTFSRQSESGIKPMQLQPILKETAKLLGSTLPSTIEVRPRIDPHCGLIEADAAQLHQAVMNICTNAYQAMRDSGGVLELSLEEKLVDGRLAATIPELNPGRHALVTIADTGDGMDEMTRERIFEPFFTTEPTASGSGMGLTTAYGIVRNHHGVITVDSELGGGATFSLYFPLYTPAPETPLPEKPTAEDEGPGGQDQHILLVDDEQPIVKLIARSLKRHGYRVESFCDSREALAWFREEPERVDLMITDLTMPHLTGTDLIQEIRRLREDLPIILCTGFSEAIGERRALGMGANALIEKPTPTAELVKTINRLLQHDGAARRS